MRSFVSIIVPAYNESEHLQACITALKSQNYPKDSYEVIVVDNESTDNTAQIAKKNQVQLLEKQPGNVGRMRNLGAKEARGEIVAFIDADCVVDPDWISRATELISQKENTVFGGGCFLPPNPAIVERCWLLGTPETMLPRELIGASIALQKNIFEKIGGFNENITSGEDTELSKQAQTLGFAIELTSKLSVIHLGNAKSAKEFVKRQIWHGENYIKDIKKSLNDPTFILINISLISILTIILSALIGQTHTVTVIASIIFLGAPSVFSIKRILRSRAIPSVKSVPAIYGLDFLYVQARSYSIIRSLFTSFFY